MFEYGVTHQWRPPAEFTANKGKTRTIMLNGVRLCNVGSWMLHSCAASSLDVWNDWDRAFHKPEVVDAFLEFLKSSPWGRGEYYSREFYLLESSNQRRSGTFKELCTRPQVKLVDQYKNKSHPPYAFVYLWRISLDRDF